MTRKLAVAVLAVALTPVCFGAGKDGNKGRGKGAGAAEHDSTRVAVNIFVGGDREIIREYVAKYPQGELPPGLAKRGGDLPPGLEKHLRKKGHLPPGLQKVRQYVFLSARSAVSLERARALVAARNAAIRDANAAVALDLDASMTTATAARATIA